MKILFLFGLFVLEIIKNLTAEHGNKPTPSAVISLYMMINVYWDRVMTDTEVYVRFIIPTPFLTIGSTSLDYLIRGHKRRRSLRSKFLNPISVDVIMSGEVMLGLPSIIITEEEFVRWLGRVSLDQVDSIEDIRLLLKVKRKYESACFVGRR